MSDQDRSVPANAASKKNKIGARKHGSFMAISTAPSINYTPIGPVMVPVPYPTVQDLTNSTETTETVNFNGRPVYLLERSTQATCKGDAAGTGKGVRSGTVSGEVRPVQGSKTVRIEGKRPVREGDSCTMNGGNNPGVYVVKTISSPVPPNNLNPLQTVFNNEGRPSPGDIEGQQGFSDAEKLAKVMQQDILDGSAFRHAHYNFQTRVSGHMLVPRSPPNIEPHVRTSITKITVSDGLRIAADSKGGSAATKYPVHTKRNEAFFWSGKTDGYGGDVAARKIASERRGTTLETLIEQKNIKMPAWDTNNPEVVTAWKTISAEYAAGASGTVRVVLGKDLRPGNVWETAELPALKNNPLVEKIVAIDPVTKVETEIFNRWK